MYLFAILVELSRWSSQCHGFHILQNSWSWIDWNVAWFWKYVSAQPLFHCYFNALQFSYLGTWSALLGIRDRHSVLRKCRLPTKTHSALVSYSSTRMGACSSEYASFLSPPVLMHDGFLWVAFCLSVCPSVCLSVCLWLDKNYWTIIHISGTKVSVIKVKGHMDLGQRSLCQTKAGGLTSTSSCFITFSNRTIIKGDRANFVKPC